MSSGVMDLMDTTLNELFEDAVQVSVNDITCDLNPGEVDPPDEPCKERDDGFFQFSFKSRFDAENVLLRHPWLVCGYLLVLMPWPSQLTLEEVKFDHTPIWHIEKNFERGSFGKGELRFRATVDLSKPLFSGFFLRRTDATGGFFPMFGNWMAEDALEKSPFQSPLPKWFTEWIIFKRAAKDEKVETIVETRRDTEEVVLNRYPIVLLPGIGEVSPFENTEDLVVEKIIPELTLGKKGTCQKQKEVQSSNNTNNGPETTDEGDETLAEKGKSSLKENIGSGPSMEDSSKNVDHILEGPIAHGPESKKAPLDKSQVYQGLFGSQAHPLKWPSKECWNLAFDQLLGATTIDKYHRDQTLFNPILDIEDFRCYEAEHGPRKRKAMDGDTDPIKVKSRRRRGRPLKEEAPLSVKPVCLKKERKRRISKKDRKHYSDPWNASAVELAIDLENHFVIIDKKTNTSSSCVISEILENEDPQQPSTTDVTIATEKTTEQIIAWNCRGLGNKAAVRQLTALIRQSNPEVIIISETRLSIEKFHSLCGKLHFIDGVHVPLIGRAGGFGLYLRSGVLCENAYGDKNLISIVIESDPPGNPWNLLGVYGPPVLT
ncbi:hypothetical protein F8388_019815 [Cannabis sativa]|uniref:DUF4283 domain-containing protein n=1 Tax=Cannabis sativa TaxID=3483 RepID=A0A7J6HNH9_CANSA|nr:hypothetical protein F8388_019815 [Cannabis sativa]